MKRPSRSPGSSPISIPNARGNIKFCSVTVTTTERRSAPFSATGQRQRRQDYGPFAEGFVEFPHALCYRCPFEEAYPACDIRCARCVEGIIIKEGPDTIGGLIVEPIVAGGGIIVPVPEYYPIIQEICRKYGILLIVDEVVCGFGRTGKFWGYEQFELDPDVVTMAKGHVQFIYAAVRHGGSPGNL